MSTTDDTSSPHLADYGSLLRRRWWIIVACLLAGTLAGLAAMRSIAPEYEASATVLVLPTDLPGQEGNVAGGRTNDAVNLDTEAQLVTSAAVAEKARKLMKSGESAGALAERVSVSVPPNSSVLTIAYADDTPEEAATGAHYFAESYLANRESSAEKQAETQAETLVKQRKDLQKRLQKVSGRIAALPLGSSDRELATAEQNVLTSQIAEIGTELAPLEDPSVNPGRIITDATPPSGPSQPAPVLFLVSAAMLGLLAGVLGAVLRDRSDHSVRSARDVTRLLDLPVLADIDFPGGPTAWVHLLPSKSGAAQEIRQLQHAVTGVPDDPPKVVLVTAASTGAATQVVAANLTAALARSGKRVALVCADLGTARSATMLGVRPGPGLAEVLLGERSVDHAMQQAQGSDLVHVLAPGLRTAEIGDELHTDNLEAIVGALRHRFDLVILETPATTVTADAQAWAQFSEAAVVAVQRLQTLREHVLHAVGQMERVGCDVLGLVVLPGHPKTGTPPPDIAVPVPDGAALATYPLAESVTDDDPDGPPTAPFRLSRPTNGATSGGPHTASGPRGGEWSR